MLAVDSPAIERSAPRWSLTTRIVFRFCLIYFGVYVVTTQMLPALLVLPVGEFPDLNVIPPVRPVVSWVAVHVFHVGYPLVVTGSGSGDKTYDWVHAFCVLVIALVGTVVWSAIDRTRGDYVRLSVFSRLFLRFALGSTMLVYAISKVVPLQMPAPSLTRLLERFGDFSPMGVLWSSIGASRGYEMFAGFAELTGGVLLFAPQTALLGALICLADTIQIFTLNMTYDVPVKLFSFHLILMSLFLLAPDARRLLNALLLNRATAPSMQPSLGVSRRARRIAVAAQIVFGIYLVSMNLYQARQAWMEYGGGAPRSVLYGIWNVDEMSFDGQVRLPLLSDNARWRRVVFDRPTSMAIQEMDDTFVRWQAKIAPDEKSLSLTMSGDTGSTARLSYQRPSEERLILDGEIAGHKIHAVLSLFDRNRFLLVNRGFHWVQEYPFNR
jgi:hypothetical protein